MKRVYSRSVDVLKLWATQAQSDARCRNVFFQGTQCYSYGRHYELGRIVTHRGKRVAMINATGFSVTTRGHISDACWAANAAGLTVVRVGSDFDMRAALKTQRIALQEQMQAHFRCLKPYSLWGKSTLHSMVTTHNALCLVLGFPGSRVHVSASYMARYDAHVKARERREIELAPIRAERAAIRSVYRQLGVQS